MNIFKGGVHMNWELLIQKPDKTYSGKSISEEEKDTLVRLFLGNEYKNYSCTEFVEEYDLLKELDLAGVITLKKIGKR
jgi:hypothetical protein